ncbi:MAG: cytochrome c oxidase assembly protein [Chloroflexota bacterium]|nr:cytochrome c oxidase assembly protein [Chloroflexota bacterium]
MSVRLTDWNWEPSILLGLALLVGAYLGAIGPWRARFQSSEKTERAQITFFLLGAFTLFIALVSPLDEWSDHYLFSAHMVQHILLTLIAPPLLLIGTPGWMLRPLLRFPAVARVARTLTLPVVAFALFNLDFAIWHLPAFYEATLENNTLHIVEHLLFMATGVLNWWPLLGSLKELPRLPAPAQILYLFLEAVPATILGAVFVFAPSPLYPTYVNAPRVFGISAADDQILSGLIMAMPGAMIYLGALSVVFFVWLDREEHAERNQAA